MTTRRTAYVHKDAEEVTVDLYALWPHDTPTSEVLSALDFAYRAMRGQVASGNSNSATLEVNTPSAP